MINEKLLEKLLAGQVDPAVAADAVEVPSALLRKMITTLDWHLIQGASRDDAVAASLVVMSRFNYALAKRLKDPPVEAQTAFTLLQLLPARIEYVEERAALADEAIPVLEREGREPRVMALAFYHAAFAHHECVSLLGVQRHRHPAIRYATCALELFGQGVDAPDLVLEQLHFVVGTYLNEDDDASEQTLQASIEHLSKSVEAARVRGDVEQLSSALNNLGNALRALGELTSDRQTLREARSTLQAALPHRAAPDQRRRTESNLATVESLLERLARDDKLPRSAPGRNREETSALAAVRAGEGFLKSILGESDLDEAGFAIVAIACGKFVQALAVASKGGDEEVQGRSEFGIGMALNFGRTGGEAVLGTCFLRAAERRFEALGDRPHLASTQFKLGEAYSTILDSRGEPSYLPLAAEYFEKAEQSFESIEHESGSRASRLGQAACFHFMAQAGDERARARSEALFRRAGVAPPPGKRQGDMKA